MNKQEQAQTILQEVDKIYSIPSYLEDHVRKAIVNALVKIENRRETGVKFNT